MKVERIYITESPADPGKVRLNGDVCYEGLSCEPETYWFEVDKKYRDNLCESGNLWLICLLPLAVTLGEELTIPRPIDVELLENVEDLIAIWRHWYPKLKPVKIKADFIQTVPNIEKTKSEKKIGAFFSGGVDAFFTALSHNSHFKTKPPHIDDFIFVHGFDIPVDNFEIYAHMESKLKNIANELNGTLVSIRSNIRKTKSNTIEWGALNLGSALASVAMLLEKRYRKVFIPSGGEGWDPHPWGSHPLTDHLWSTQNLKIVHDDIATTRIEKTTFISKSKLAHQALKVCWQNKSKENCCKCSKCYRTIISLDMLGVLDEFATFKNCYFDNSIVSRIYHSSEPDIIFFNQIKDVANEKGRKKLVKVIEASLKRSRRINRYLPIAKKFSSWSKNKHFFWRFCGKIEKLLLQNAIF